MASSSPQAFDRQNKPLGHEPDLPHLLLLTTGSVATIKLPNILSALSHYCVSVRVILTSSSVNFLQGQASEQPHLKSLQDIPNVDGIYLDEDEWSEPWTRGEKILHIELRRWADLMAIVPLSADSLAKVAGGLADGLGLSVVRAWDTTGLIDPVRLFGEQLSREQVDNDTGSGNVDASSERRKKSIIAAPAMNTAMWMHPITSKHIRLLEEDWGVKNGGWFEVLRPMEKELACGDVGAGAMMDWTEIVKVLVKIMALENQDR